MRTPMQQKSPSGARLAGWGLFRHFWNNVICVFARLRIDYCRRRGFFVSHPCAAVEGERFDGFLEGKDLGRKLKQARRCGEARAAAALTT